MRIRWLLIIIVLSSTILLAGYQLVQAKSKAMTTYASTSTLDQDPAPDTISDRDISAQVTSIEDIQASTGSSAVEPVVRFANDVADYGLSYPPNWEVTMPAEQTVTFQALDISTRVDVVVTGPVPVEGLTGYVDHALIGEDSASRYSLLVNGYPAEHILFETTEPGTEAVTFYIEFDNSIVIISGYGEQQFIEAIARSFDSLNSDPVI